MNPQQPGQNPYDFILAPQKTPAPKVYLPGGNGKASKIALVGGLFVVLVIIIIVVISLFSKPNPNTTALLGLAETEQEINRIAVAGQSQTTQQGLKNSSITIALTVETHQNKAVAYIKSQGTTVTLAQLALKKSATTDAQLTTATQNSTYDIVYAQVLQNELKSYATELKTDYGTVTGTNARNLLKGYYTDTQKLITQLAANTPPNPNASPAP